MLHKLRHRIFLRLLAHHSFGFDIYEFTFERMNVLLDIKRNQRHKFIHTWRDRYLFIQAHHISKN